MWKEYLLITPLSFLGFDDISSPLISQDPDRKHAPTSKIIILNGENI
jgi:hypothetical protein